MECAKTVGCVFKLAAHGKFFKAVCCDDCDENAGGLYVELYQEIDDDPRARGMLYNEDWTDTCCVHPEDCDVDDEEEVREYIQQYLDWAYAPENRFH